MVQATKARKGAIDGALAASDDELFQAVAVLVQRLKRAHAPGEAEHGARAFLLGHIDRLGPLRMSDLATTACLDQSTVSRHLRQLEEAGLVTRSPDPDDRRATLLELSASGREWLERAVRARAQLMADATAAWSPGDRADLVRLLTRLANDLETTS